MSREDEDLTMAFAAIEDRDATIAALTADKRDLLTQLAKSTAAIAKVAGERDHLKRREQSIIEACERVADGGQYRADIVSAIQSLRRARDAARAECDAWRIVTGADTPEALAAELDALRARIGHSRADDLGGTTDDHPRTTP